MFSFAFCHLMGYVNDLCKEHWPYLQGTRGHTVNLSDNEIGGQEQNYLLNTYREARIR